MKKTINKKKKVLSASEMGKKSWEVRKGNINRNNKGHFVKKISTGNL